MHSGILSLEELTKLVADWRAQHLEVGFTCGAFDLFHAGHAHYLQRARLSCRRLIVAVNSDKSIRAYKSPLRPIIGEKHRASLVTALASVDAVILMHEQRPAKLIEILKPDVYFKGGDYQTSQLRSATLVESYGGRCEVIPVEHEISTSMILRRIEELSLYASPEKSRQQLGSPIVFLDRDGTLIANVHFLNDPSRVRLLPGVGEGLRTLQEAGFRLVVITNQQGIGLGYFDYETFVAVNSVMLKQLASFGVSISKFYFCPHSFAEKCECRKPGTKLIERALEDFGSKAKNCFFTGDTISDMVAADSAGCCGVLLSSNPNDVWPHRAPSFAGVVAHILAESQLLSKAR